MKRARPFVLPMRRPDTHHRPAAGDIGPADIVIVNGDSVRVCRVETAIGPLLDGPTPLTLCRDTTAGEAAGLVEGLRVTQVGEVLMLRVE